MKRLLPLLLTLLLCLGCAPADVQSPAVWSAGFGEATIALEPDAPRYLAGYHNGVAPDDIRDLPAAQALWLDDGSTSLLLIAVDCVGLDGGSVANIRDALAGFCRTTGCASVNVVATHSHAGPDTLGLWGPIGINGKHADDMAALTDAAVAAAKAAYADRRAGTLSRSVTPTDALQRDSRDPQVYDTNLYGLRFAPADGTRGIRILSYAAHAESLRGKNRRISRDFPGLLRDAITAETGDASLFLPGAVGGLIMTRELVEVVDQASAEANLAATADALTAYALAPGEEMPLAPSLACVRVDFETPLDNTLFLYYKFLGILRYPIARRPGGYTVESELTILRLGGQDGLTLALLPGELFPELISGESLTDADPTPLREIAAAHGIDDLVIVGLANGELGYILPPSAFVLDETFPYVNAAKGHYEETNSVGPACALDLAEAFARACQALAQP